METADSLKIKLGCKTDADLGLLFGRGDKAVSAWRIKGLPAAIERRAHQLLLERGIISEQPQIYVGNRGGIAIPHPILDDLDLDEVEMLIIRKVRERGPSAKFKFAAQLIDEDEAAAKHNE